MDRNETIKTIRAALKRRSGKSWSVTGGTGTAWGWITIDVPPARRTWWNRSTDQINPETGHLIYEPYDSGKPGGKASPDERAELAKLLGLEHVYDHVSIPASTAYYQEYMDRAEGRAPTRIGTPYWD